MRIRPALVCLLAVIASGCASVAVDDVSVDALSLVELNIEKPVTSGEGTREYLRVEFHSGTNLEHSRKKLGAVWLEAYPCERPDAWAFIAVRDIYWNGRNVTRPRIESEWTTDRITEANVGPPYHYEGLLNLVHFGPQSFVEKGVSKQVYKFDLARNPEDICVQVVGGYYLERFRSNVVKLDAREIQRAIGRGQEC